MTYNLSILSFIDCAFGVFLVFLNFILFFLAMPHARHALSQFPDQGLNPCPLQWKSGVLTTGLPGKSRAFGVVSKKLLLYPRSPIFSPILSFRSFVVLHFTFRSVIPFQLIFVKGVRSMFGFNFFAYGYSVVPKSLVEKTIFVPLYCLCPFVKDQLTIFIQVYFLAFYSVPLIYLSVVLPIHCLDYCSFM